MSAAVEQGRLTASRDAPVGGQAVLEGVMMRGVGTWAVAVRKPPAEDRELGDIGVQSFPLESWNRRRRIYRWPVIRGVVALVESLAIGMRALGISANAQLPEEEQEISSGVWVGTVVVAARLRDRPVLRRPGRTDQPDQAPARLLGGVLGGRGRAADRDLPRLPAAALARA